MVQQARGVFPESAGRGVPVMFCPKCGSLLMPKDVNKKRVMACSCGYRSGSGDFSIAETVKSKEKRLEVVEEQETLPITDAQCPKCGHPKAYYWMKQTRAADEAETRFFRCEKCRNAWRDYF